MKIYFSMSVMLISLMLFSACAKGDLSESGGKDNTEVPVLGFDTITYKAMVYATEEIVNQRYGGFDKFNKDMEVMFNNVTTYWNSSKNKFNYYFKFVHTGLELYPDAEYNNYIKKISGPLDNQYDIVVLFNLNADGNGGWCTGANGHSYIVITKTVKDQEQYGNIFNATPQNKQWGVYSTLSHELGHYRGATDIYQYGISSSNNPVNGAVFEEPKCIMNDSGCWEWSDYCSAVFNYTAKWLRLPSGYSGDRFPENMEILITENKVPLKGAEVNFYGCRGNGTKKDRTDGVTSPDVYGVPFRTYKTDDNGKIIVSDVEHLYQVQRKNETTLPESLPYEYWFNFLVIAKHPTNGKTSYIWLPDLEMQRDHLENGTETYKVLFEFK